ncbi:unnamed protein product [Paramecium primaurelia]|uniref:MORN repeat protein n=1 Tax=Paramecium primaurelia TaxID=5886 RepID=A0A8S1MUG7_PARPR|nr:unnamed protein product [Paramecium primaurelia]
MGNQCKGQYCDNEYREEVSHTPLDIFNKIVKIQAIIRGFLSRRQKLILKNNKQLLMEERRILKKFGFHKLEHILTYKILRKKNIKIIVQDTQAYVGEINSQNQPHGIGRIVYSNNSYKEGEYQNGELRKGIYYFNDVILQGQFQNNLLHGRGRTKFKDGTTYEGGFERGIRSGYGKLIDINGNIFEGQFKNGLLNGDGEFVGKDGRYYNGEWLNGKYHGRGELLFPDGQKYIGEFENHRRHGFGQQITQHGQYVGTWRNGKQYGEGQLLFNGQQIKCINGCYK